jgi:DNA-3-methyladenine glycosylase I
MLFMERCSWCLGDELYEKYHDEEWGVAVREDKELFEFLILEGAQAGLSWITILKKRESYREAFDSFDFEKVALYGEDDIQRLMGDEGIIRNRLKILSAIGNARVFVEIRSEFGSFSKYLWGFVGGETVIGSSTDITLVSPDGSLVESELSREISRDLKRRGMKFVGPVIIYAYLEAVGVLCNHEVGCAKFKKF